MIAARNIAVYFIGRSFLEGITVTNIQLQKMVFITNGLYLGLKKEPLIKEKVEVWDYGPVIRDVYDSLIKFGNHPINSNIPGIYSHPIDFNDPEIEDVIEFTWNTCKRMNATQLANWTTSDYSPWTRALKENKATIPNVYMAEYFTQFVA